MHSGRIAQTGSDGLSAARVGVWLIALAYLGFCAADMLLSIQDDRSASIKIAAFGLLALAVALRPRFHKRLFYIIPLAFVFLIALFRSFSVNAGLDELQRFLFPVAITVALYAYRDQLDFLVSAFLVVVATNDLFQCYFYIAYFLKLPLLIPVRIDSGLYLRAQGWIGFFSEFGFMNFCALMLYAIRENLTVTRFKSTCLTIFSISSFSFKLLPVLAAYQFVFARGRLRTCVLLIVGALVSGIAIVSGVLDEYTGLAASKISFYIVAGNSARAESYRVMWESLTGGNFLGEGLGAFGGPASVRYNSPLYGKFHFNWYGMQDVLKTTDTFYPHLFVETGLIGGAIWLFFVIMYGQEGRRTRGWIFIVLAFLFDNIFSLAILSPSYVFPALLVMYCFSYSGNPGVKK